MDNFKLVGEKYLTKHSGFCRIVEVTNRKNITVEFEDGYRTVCNLHNLKKGSVLNPFHPKIYGVGFIGVGEYESKNDGEIHPFYDAWRGALRRSYDPLFHKKFPLYKDCEVHEDWHNYQNFCEWSSAQVFYKGYKLDKDILVQGNKLYGPDTCVYLPNELNCIISNRWDDNRGLPRGVSISANPNAKKKIYVASLRRKGVSNLNLGYFDSPEEAYLVYKYEKEKYVKERAMFWKDRISEKAFKALMEWEL